MAAAVRAITSIALGNRTNTTLTAPAGLADNDILVCIMSTGDGGDETAPTVTPPAGFAALTGSPAQISKNDPYAIGMNLFWKLAASESGSYVFTHGAADSEGVLYAISGADATPINPNPTTATGLDAVLTATGLTTPANDSLVIWAGLTWDLAGPSTPPTGTTPTFTERYDPGTGVMYIADGVLATAGATGNKAVTTPNGSGNPWRAALICIEAGAGAAGITGNVDVVTNYTPGYKFKILSVDFAVTTIASTAAKLATLNLEIGTTNLTGGAVALTTANCGTLGAVVAGSAVTAANTGTSADTISVEASSVTAFVEGSGALLIKIQNMDTADAIASVLQRTNKFRTDLVELGLTAGA